MSTTKDLIIMFIVFSITNSCIHCGIFSMKMIPERATIDYTNDKYMSRVKVNVRRYGRRGDYFVNLEGNIYHTWGNNVSFHVHLYELLHNEYKRTFVEFHFKHICDMIKSDPYLGKAVANTGIECPVPPGFYVLANMSIPFEDFPYAWPFERARGVGTVTCGDKADRLGVVLGNGSLYMRFVQKKKKP